MGRRGEEEGQSLGTSAPPQTFVCLREEKGRCIHTAMTRSYATDELCYG